MFEKIKVFLKNQKHEPNIVEVTHLCIMHRVYTSSYEYKRVFITFESVGIFNFTMYWISFSLLTYSIVAENIKEMKKKLYV